MPPMRCIRPGVPGIAQGRARVSGSRRYGQNSPSWLGSVANGTEMSGSAVDVGQQPRLGAVGDVAVGEEDHRACGTSSAMPHRLERGVEAVAGRPRGDDRQRRLAVAAVHREQEVGLLGLGGQSGRRTAALHVDDDQRQLEADGEPERLRLEVEPGTAGGGDAELTGERGADRHRGGGDLVLGLQRADAEVLVLRQLVQDVGRRRDRVRRVEDRQAGALGGGDEPVGDREVAGDVAVLAGLQARRLDLVVLEQLGGLAEVQAGLERGEVGVADLRAGREALVDPLDRSGRPAGCTSTR